MACLTTVSRVACTCAIDTLSITATIKQTSLHGAILACPTALAVAGAVKAITISIAITFEPTKSWTEHHITSPSSPTFIANTCGSVADSVNAFVTRLDATIIGGPAWVALANTVVTYALEVAIIWT